MSFKVFLIPVLFFVVSFVFSMLGMGGSQLYIPLLYWMGMDFKKEAIPLGLLLNIVTSSSAAYTYWRSGLVRVGLALPFALSMVVMAPVGAFLNFKIHTGYVILVFALFTIISSFLALSGYKPEKRLEGRAEKLVGVAVGSLLGVVVGFAGRGGGAMVVPVLLLMGLEPKSAAATSSFIVTLAACSGLLGHLANAHFHPAVTLFCCIAVFLGSRLGSRFMAQRMSSKNVRYVFGLLLLFVGLLLLRDALSLILKD